MAKQSKATPFPFAARIRAALSPQPIDADVLANTADIAERASCLIFRDVEALALVACGRKVDWQRELDKPYKPELAIMLVVAAYRAGTLADICARLPAMEQAASDYSARQTRGRPLSRYYESGDKATPTTTPPPTTPDKAPAADELAALIARIAGAGLDREAVARIATEVAQTTVGDALKDMVQPTRIEVARTDAQGAVTVTGARVCHAQYAKLLALVQVRDVSGFTYPVWLPGPAGSGKTTAAMQLAKDLELSFHHNGAVDGDYRLLGMLSVQGTYIRTAFREAYEHGGVYLFDEVDASHPSALVALNAALENGHCQFPDMLVNRHPDCIIIAAANTYGQGATHEYVGRVKLDAATIDRFIMLDWPYDEALETALSGNPEWARKVQAWRAKAATQGVKHIISPRATIRGAALLAAGMAETDVIDMVIRKGLPDASWARIK